MRIRVVFFSRIYRFLWDVQNSNAISEMPKKIWTWIWDNFVFNLSPGNRMITEDHCQWDKASNLPGTFGVLHLFTYVHKYIHALWCLQDPLGPFSST